MTFTIAIGLGLTERVLGCDVQRECDPDHVGRAESERLMGSGREFGRGPLPTFLSALDSARLGGSQLATVLVADEGREASSKAHRPQIPGIPGIPGLDGNPSFVAAPGGRIPWPSILETIEEVSGTRALVHDGASLRFLLLGCHTERHVLSMALLIRGILPEAEVAVSPHLVGSAVAEAHLAALRHNLPLAGVHVLQDLADAAAFASIDAQPLRRFTCSGCLLEPQDLLTKLSEPSRRILEGVCLHWTRATLKPLSGGFSGSLLMVASGEKNGAETEPMVIKVDRYSQMRREIDGYHLVKDFLGKHVPTFGYPVSRADMLGVGMELAAMEGSPASLQESFEEAESDAEVDRYTRRLDKALHLIATRLHRNTRRTEWVSPYRAFHLHTDLQCQWLRENVSAISDYWQRDVGGRLPSDARMLESLLRLIGTNEDGVEGDICLVHGDLNFKNIICDDADNVWFIDWTHSGWQPVELDFAKLENDAKFVISKRFDLSDMPRLRQLEDYFLSQPMPATPEQLPETLRFARWDLRFREILLSVRRIRETCFAIKHTESWLLYRAALLKYSLHTLSFDKRRDRGECDLPQLAHALHATEALLNDLVVDDFQLRIRGERPPTYPPRQRVSIDLAPWNTECPEYAPPYHVEPAVLAHDYSMVPGGWAEPEDITRVRFDERGTDAHRDEIGRPLHPFGRTGIAGRGALGSWGPNLALVAIVTRARDDGAVDVLLGSRSDSNVLRPPQGWVRRSEEPEAAFRRIVCAETGWCPEGQTTTVSEAYGYDSRRTDHAWVVMHARLLLVNELGSPPSFSAAAMFDSVGWYPLEGATINRVPAGLARRMRDAVKILAERGELTSPVAAAILAASG